MLVVRGRMTPLSQGPNAEGNNVQHKSVVPLRLNLLTLSSDLLYVKLVMTSVDYWFKSLSYLYSVLQLQTFTACR